MENRAKRIVAWRISIKSDTPNGQVKLFFLLMYSSVDIRSMYDYDDILGIPCDILQRTG